MIVEDVLINNMVDSGTVMVSMDMDTLDMEVIMDSDSRELFIMRHPCIMCQYTPQPTSQNQSSTSQPPFTTCPPQFITCPPQFTTYQPPMLLFMEVITADMDTDSDMDPHMELISDTPLTYQESLLMQ
jgi:hypothetical protein